MGGIVLVALLAILGVVLAVPALWVTALSLLGAWIVFWICVGIRYKKILRLLVAIDGARVAAGGESAFNHSPNDVRADYSLQKLGAHGR